MIGGVRSSAAGSRGTARHRRRPGRPAPRCRRAPEGHPWEAADVAKERSHDRHPLRSANSCGPARCLRSSLLVGTAVEAARQRCGSGTVPACFRWTIGALFGRPKREKPSGFYRVFGPWTAGAGASFYPARSSLMPSLTGRTSVRSSVNAAGNAATSAAIIFFQSSRRASLSCTGYCSRPGRSKSSRCNDWRRCDPSPHAPILPAHQNRNRRLSLRLVVARRL
jgi:hypothetical protein